MPGLDSIVGSEPEPEAAPVPYTRNRMIPFRPGTAQSDAPSNHQRHAEAEDAANLARAHAAMLLKAGRGFVKGTLGLPGEIGKLGMAGVMAASPGTWPELGELVEPSGDAAADWLKRAGNRFSAGMDKAEAAVPLPTTKTFDRILPDPGAAVAPEGTGKGFEPFEEFGGALAPGGAGKLLGKAADAATAIPRSASAAKIAKGLAPESATAEQLNNLADTVKSGTGWRDTMKMHGWAKNLGEPAEGLAHEAPPEVHADTGAAPAPEMKRVSGSTLREMVQGIADTGSDAHKLVAGKVLNAIDRLEKDHGVNFKFDIATDINDPKLPDWAKPNMSKPGTGAITGRNSSPGNSFTHVILKDPSWHPGGTSHEVGLHEAVHAVTSGVVEEGMNAVPASVRMGLSSADPKNKLGENVRDLLDVHSGIRGVIKGLIDQTGGNGEKLKKLSPFAYRVATRENNAFANPHETIAWGMTSPQAQRFMDQISLPNGRSGWSNFVTGVREALGLPKSADTALSEVMRVSDNLMSDKGISKSAERLANQRGYVLGMESGQPVIDSTGKPVHPSPEGQQNFSKWFGDSQVVDDQGRPLRVYKGVNGDYTTLKPSREGGSLGNGIYTTPDAEFASGYAEGAHANVMPLYARITNPLRVETATGSARDPAIELLKALGIPENKAAKLAEKAYDDKGYLTSEIKSRAIKAGYDGIIQTRNGVPREVVPFESTQVKSATGNRGSFNESPFVLANDNPYGLTPGHIAGTEPLPPQHQVQVFPAEDLGEHAMLAKRGERQVGTEASISDAERSVIAEAAKKYGVPEQELLDEVTRHKLQNPTEAGWLPLALRGVKKKGEEGAPELPEEAAEPAQPMPGDENSKFDFNYQKKPSQFHLDENGKALKVGTPEYDARVRGLGDALVDEVRNVYARAQRGDKAARSIIAQAGWYKEFKDKMRRSFGGLGDVFADLLGSTSPNTAVRLNWDFAIDALRNALRGDYDHLMPQWIAWQDNISRLQSNLEAKIREWKQQDLDPATGKAIQRPDPSDPKGKKKLAGMSDEQIKALPEYQADLEEVRKAKELPESLVPRNSGGNRFGMNSRNVIYALTDLWRTVDRANAMVARGASAPKAINFSGNLIGYTHRATIDVWAARLLQRLAGFDRVPIRAQTGVAGKMLPGGETIGQFRFGQDVFEDAARKIRDDPALRRSLELRSVNPDDLQAVVWFLEKEHWTKNNWTSAAGEGGSFEAEHALAGSHAGDDQIAELRKIIDSSKSTKAMKRDAIRQLNELSATPTRWTAGLSPSAKGVEPTDATMAGINNELRRKIHDADTDNRVIVSKAQSSLGWQSGRKRTTDLELVTKQGFDPSAAREAVFDAAQRNGQDSAFIARVLHPGENVDPLHHRPGLEVYVNSPEAMQALSRRLERLGKGYTMVTDGRPTAETMSGMQGKPVGVRILYSPEHEERYGVAKVSHLSDEKMAANTMRKAGDLRKLGNTLESEIPGVTHVHRLWYDVETRFAHELPGVLNEIRAAKSGIPAQAGASGGHRPVWRGRSHREAVEGANSGVHQGGTGGKNGPEPVLAGGDAPVRKARGGLIRPPRWVMRAEVA